MVSSSEEWYVNGELKITDNKKENKVVRQTLFLLGLINICYQPWVILKSV